MFILISPCDGCSARDSYCSWNCPLLDKFETTAKKFRELGKLSGMNIESEEDFEEFCREVY